MNVFLTAEWRNLVNLTYEVPPELLEEYLPKGIELDTALNGKAHVSLVAFDFLNTKVRGLSIPWHINFPEINLRFYVRYRGQVGVVFIREYVPKYCIALVANRIYNEPYQALPMTSQLTNTDTEIRTLHWFRKQRQTFEIEAAATSTLYTPEENSPDHYFKEHTWGFGISHAGQTLCYRVEHPVWQVYPMKSHRLSVDFGVLYGKKWDFLKDTEPAYQLFAEGSAVKVFSAITLAEFDELHKKS
jgi:uncharacterized protein YqjF (DUF2071 family)